MCTIYIYVLMRVEKTCKKELISYYHLIIYQLYFFMEALFSSLDTILDLPFPAFEKRLSKFEEDFRNISITDVSEEELESYFNRIRDEYRESTGDRAKTRLETL